ncbi:MAG: sulfite exporter TauE/SafE family protein [Actinomycetota bacterium]
MWNKLTLILFFLLACAILTSGHPLGNFTVNNFTRIEIEKNRVRLNCVLDMAEIPTFQESQKIDTDKNGLLEQTELNNYQENFTPQFIANLKLLIDDQPVRIESVSKNILLLAGAGNLSTLRMEWAFVTENFSIEKDTVHHLRFENNNYKERVGWNEIVVNRADSINVFDSTAFGSTLTDDLRTYPENMLSAPLAERFAEFSFTSSTIPANAKLLQNRNGSASTPVQKDKFAELISVGEITPAIALFGLLFAFGFGAMHAMSPGHGKTVVGAYLVGSRGTIKHAVFLGLTVTITHTLGVFALGLITLFASNYILPEKLMPFLSFVSGLLVLFIGLSLFKERLFSALGWQSHDGHTHEHGDHLHSREHLADYPHDGHDNHLSHNHEAPDPQTHGNGHTHTHGGREHTHLPPENITWKNLLALGISGGLLPCPSALVLMLSAISLGRVGYGLILTIVFSFGLAATLTGVGLIFLYIGKAFGGTKLADNRIFKMLPVFSAFIIACIGAVICYNSLA